MTENKQHDTIRAVTWVNDQLQLLDQRVLPQRVEYLRLTDAAGVAQAIKDMVVRGAPAIGIAAAYGVVLAARACYARAPKSWKQDIAAD
ncbi:MAG: S-methyl-5-thioribose-1-phosphate isomerase, partial [Gammaproteobacteria bacterium]|nr:S-methyl-5-thioribose-1-phosphate isomerase [Gammaproteobacteria bacterium]